MLSLIKACERDNWFILRLKFDRQTAPHMSIANAIDDFFRTWSALSGSRSGVNHLMMGSLNQICQSLLLTVGSEGFGQLSDICPSIALCFPQVPRPQNQNLGISSNDKVGSAHKRRKYLFEVVVRSICSVGVPLLVCFDDLHYTQKMFQPSSQLPGGSPAAAHLSPSFAMELLADIIESSTNASISGNEAGRRGMLFVGAYRSNEVALADDIVGRMGDLHRSGRIGSFRTLHINGLGRDHLRQWLSESLCLPPRYTAGLASIVASKVSCCL